MIGSEYMWHFTYTHFLSAVVISRHHRSVEFVLPIEICCLASAC